MFSPRSSAARWARAGSIGVWTTLTALVAHLLADGTAPPGVVLVPVVALATGTAWWAAQRRLSLPVVLGLLATSQVIVHALTGYVHGHLMTPSVLMVASHVVALGLTALAIAHVETLWWAIWQWWTRRASPLVLLRPIVATARAACVVASSRPLNGLLEGPVSRRGPPVL